VNLEKRKTGELKFYLGNPRKISDDMLFKLRQSIKEFGFVDPLIINKDNEVIGGNQRLKAAVEEGIEEVPVVVVELSRDKEKALNLALNKIQGEWDEELLRRIHPTQKPVGIHIKILEYMSDGEEPVLDLFSGSGSTLIACEHLNRTCYTMEIDPYYCDVIIDRWETYTGQKAVKL